MAPLVPCLNQPHLAHQIRYFNPLKKQARDRSPYAKEFCKNIKLKKTGGSRYLYLKKTTL